VALLSASAAAVDRAVVPDWVRQAASQTLPSYPSDTNAVVLLDDAVYTVISASEYVEHDRRVVKILRPTGEGEGTFAVHFHAGEKVNSVHGWSIDSSGHEFEVKDKDFLERAQVNESLYEDVRFRVATVPASVTGSVVAFEAEARRHPYLEQIVWIPQELNPVRSSSLTVELPSGYEYKDLWLQMKPATPNRMAANRWQWTLTDLPPIKQEQHMPDFGALAGRMKITYFAPGVTTNTDSWNALGKWYEGLTSDRRNSTPEISAEAHRLADSKSDFVSKVRAITDFMQKEVRYVSIQIGVGGYQPHPAGDVFRARYGDCKDKATLLITMLHEVGVNAHYVIISTDRGVVRPEMPSSLFDHAIVAIEIPADAKSEHLHSLISDKAGKKYLLFDPTNPVTPLGEIPNYLQDSYALLVLPSGGEITRTPVLDPDYNHSVRKGKFKLTPEGTLDGKFEGTMTGYAADVNRDIYRSLSELERTQTAERFVARSLRAAAVKDLKLEALDHNTDELVLKFGVTSEKYAQISGPLMLVRPRVIGQHALGLERKERLYPIELPSTVEDEDEFEIELPSGYAIDDVPEPKKIDSSFASYQSEFNVDGSKITYKRKFVNRALEIPTDKIAEFRSFQNQIAEDENAVVVLKKVN
jgi:hypothetical protein